MPYRDFLEILSNGAAILTAAIASIAYGRFVAAERRRRKTLEDYLRDEKLMGDDQGRRTVLHLMSSLGMTEAEVLKAGFTSKVISSAPGMDERGRADCVFFEYDGDDLPAARTF